jgi:1,2-diacylglycerol 3-beta-glucosyltransferase
VADRCTDATARIAEAAGAEALELESGGGSKAAAVIAGIAHLAAREWDVLLVVDADCRIEGDFLARVDCTPDEAAQADVVERADEPGDRVYEFLTRLKNDLFHAGRARLGLPAFLRGTGMLLGRGALERCPWSATGLAEDRAQGMLFLAAGVPVRHAGPALAVWTSTPHGWRQSWTQRRRWTSTSLPRGVSAAARTAWRLLPHSGLRALELPLAVLADARSQWLLLLVAGVILCAAGGGAWWPGVLLLLVTGALAAVAGFTWYGPRFLQVVLYMPRSGLLALSSATLSLLGRVPTRWQRGH